MHCAFEQFSNMNDFVDVLKNRLQRYLLRMLEIFTLKDKIYLFLMLNVVEFLGKMSIWENLSPF